MLFHSGEDQDDPLGDLCSGFEDPKRVGRGELLFGARWVRLSTDALASLAAITLDRCVSFEKEIQIEQAHQSECLRAAVLDSTCARGEDATMTAIQTANSGLREVGTLNASQAQLVSLVENECAQLSQLCNRLLQTAKLDTEEVTLHKDEIMVSELLGRVVREQSGARSKAPDRSCAFPDTSMKISGDPELLSMALVQFLDNASKYSFAGEKVKVSAWESNSEVTALSAQCWACHSNF